MPRLLLSVTTRWSIGLLIGHAPLDGDTARRLADGLVASAGAAPSGPARSSAGQSSAGSEAG
ncbi:MAG TPA: hypothetical protein VH141_19695 [Pseudonocardia sp.]|jgi:hypothetical protein|nr:hypothetical protein [Pseudonocardia sp.]